LLEGDSNTKYFQLVVNGKYKNSRIFQLQHEDQVIEGEAVLKQHITSYYKNLFGPPESNTLSLAKSRMDDISQMSVEENEQLVKPVSEEEVHHAIFQMEPNKAPGLNGLPAEFY
jgi:hypothetical protein